MAKPVRWTQDEIDAFVSDAHRRHIRNAGQKKKWTPDEVAVRREGIYREMGKGKSYSQMVRELIDRWGASDRTIRIWVSDAKDALIKTNAESREEYCNKMYEKLERLAAEAEEAGDRKSMLAAYEMMNKMNGVYTQKVEADIKGETTIAFKFGNEEETGNEGDE